MITRLQHNFKRFQKAISLDMGSLIQNAEKHMDRNNYKQARRLWIIVLARFPSNAPLGVYVRLAKCYLELRQPHVSKTLLAVLHRKSPLYVTRHLLDTELELFAKLREWPRLIQVCTRIKEYSKTHGIPGLVALARFNESIAWRIIDIEHYKAEIIEYKKGQTPKRTVRVAIYTARTGSYDSPKLPVKLNPQYDYVIFTDLPVEDTGVFKVKPLPYFDYDPVRAARYVKTHPHLFLCEYDIAVWIDASILILDDVSDIIDKFISSNLPIGAIPHPHRENIYREATACIEMNKDDSALITAQMKSYRQQSYRGDQLIESGLMAFNLRDQELPKILDFWWSQLNTFSRRDQLSLPVAIEKYNIKWHPLMKAPLSIRNHKNFVLTPHTIDKQSNELLNNLISGGKVIEPINRELMNSEDFIFKGSVDVIVCVHNALEEVKKCLESIDTHHPKNNFRLIIINDGSDEITSDFLYKFSKIRKWVVLKRKKTGSGYSKAANRGLKISTADLVFLLNSDTIVTNRWIDKMAEVMFSGLNVGIVGPISSAASHQSIPNHISARGQTATNALPKGYTPEDMNIFCEKVAHSSTLVPLVHGFCQAIRREVIEKIGYFDDKHFPKGYGEENDYCFRAADAGFTLAIATHTYIYHSKSKSYIDEERIKLMQNGAKKLQELYGKDRITRSILTMQHNPILKKLRQEAEVLYLK